MSDIYIAGVGMTQFGRQLDRSLKDLSADACARAFADAGCGREDIEAVFFGNCVQGHMEGQDMIRGELVARAVGMQGVPVVNVENACATASTAVAMAGCAAAGGSGQKRNVSDKYSEEGGISILQVRVRVLYRLGF